MKLKDKVAIVTGGASGFGRAICETYAREGASVLVADINGQGAREVAREIGGKAAHIAVDVSKKKEVDAMVAEAVKTFGGLDIMVNNAGTAGPTAPVEEVSLEDWTACLTVNMTSAFLGTRKAVPALRAAGGGSIVNLSSAAGKFAFPMRSPYSAAKFGIVGFTRTCAMELGRYGIRVNCIQPGPVEGARIDRVIRAKAEAAGISENAMRDQMTATTHLRSFVTAGDIANQILFLCSDAGRRITGQALSVDAGLEGLV
jgi:NAD(P)-dependent dehydrogenase (short-subunit alcohol dehydrogenase family)